MAVASLDRHPGDLPARRGRENLTVPRIDWGRRSGEEIETVVGILLCRRHPHAERITPSQGDDGLDVIVRDPDGWTIYQVKKYASQPTSDQKAKIKKSFEKILSNQAALEAPVKRWHLAMPANPTPPSLTWFRNLTSGAPFPCTWSGLDFVDGLAAEFPDVPDYYFFDGKERLLTAISELTRATSLAHTATADADVPIQVAIEGIAAAHRLANRLDPHFQYDFSIDSTEPPVPQNDGLIFAETRGIDDRFITFRVFEKYREALRDRPITVRVQMRAPDDATRTHIEDFLEYGAPLRLSPGLATIDANAPGGLGGISTGELRILPMSEQRDEVMRLRIEERESSEEVATATVLMAPSTGGASGANRRAVGSEQGGAFEIELRYTTSSGELAFTFRPNDPSGKVAARVAEGLRFLASLKHPRVMRVAKEFGPFFECIDIPEGASEFVASEVLDLVESISTLQALTAAQLVVPDLSTLTRGEALNIIDAEKLVRGEVLEAHVDELTVVSNGSPVPEEDVAVFTTQEMGIVIEGTAVQIGIAGFHVPRAKLTVEPSDDGGPDKVVARSASGGRLDGTVRLMQPEHNG